MKHLKNDYLIAGLIYLVSLAIMVFYALVINHNAISDHSTSEYEAYLLMLQHGGWINLEFSNMHSCVMSTLVPAMLQRVLGLDGILIFNIFPCLFYSMVPVFTYLAARTHLNISQSLCAVTLVILCSTHISPEGRVGIAVGFLAGLIWAISTQHFKSAIIFTVFIPFSHYATGYIAIFFLAAPLLYLILKRHFWSRDFKLIGISLLLLSGIIFVWYNIVTIMPAYSGQVFLKYAKISASTINPSTDVSFAGDSVAQKEIYYIESRESLIQDAAGKSFGSWDAKKKIGFVLSWLIIIFMALGALYALFRRVFPVTYRILVVVAFALLFSTVAVPYMSTHYGVGRVYLTGIVALAPMFMNGLAVISSKIRVNGALIGMVILSIHSWATSGLVGDLVELL